MPLDYINSVDTDLRKIPVSLLLWGKPRTFKSRFAATFPKPFFFDFDKGLPSLAEFGVDGISYGINAGDWLKFDKDFTEFCKDCQWQTIVIDSCTSMAVACLNWLLAKYNKTDPDKHVWGQRARIMSDVLYRLAQEVPEINTIVICHEKEITDDAGNVTTLAPMLPGEVAQRGSSFFPEVYQTTIKAIKPDGTGIPVIKTSPHRTIIRGSRINIRDLEHPTYACFLERREEALKDALQKQQALKTERAGTPSLP